MKNIFFTLIFLIAIGLSIFYNTQTTYAMKSDIQKVIEVKTADELYKASNLKGSFKIKLLRNIILDKDLNFYTPNEDIYDIELNLNGFELELKNGACLYAGLETEKGMDEYLGGRLNLFIIGEKINDTITFSYYSETGLPGQIVNLDYMATKNITIKTKDLSVKKNKEPQLDALVTNGFYANLVIESTDIRVGANVGKVIHNLNHAKMAITNSLIEVTDGNECYGLFNEKGEVNISNSSISIDGDYCIGISSISRTNPVELWGMDRINYLIEHEAYRSSRYNMDYLSVNKVNIYVSRNDAIGIKHGYYYICVNSRVTVYGDNSSKYEINHSTESFF